MRARPRRAEAGFVPRVRHLLLVLEPRSEPIRGTLTEAGHPPEAFRGWIELAAAIERARERGSEPVAVPRAPCPG